MQTLVSSRCRILFSTALALGLASGAMAYNAAQYEESAGLSIAVMSEPGGDVHGGGFESGVWLRGTPIFSEIFGHWLSNKLQDGNYYSVGLTIRLMPRTDFAPFIGGGGSYNGLTSERNRRFDPDDPTREADKRYWAGHAEAGARLWFGPRAERFFEGGYRYHWTDTSGDFNYGLISIEYGQLF